MKLGRSSTECCPGPVSTPEAEEQVLESEMPLEVWALGTLLSTSQAL